MSVLGAGAIAIAHSIKKKGKIDPKVADGIKDGLQDLAEKGSKKAEEIVPETVEKTKNIVADATNQVVKKTEDVTSEVVEKAKDVVTDTVEQVTDVASKTSEEVKNIVTDTTEVVAKKSDEVKEVVAKKTDKIAETVNDKAKQIQQYYDDSIKSGKRAIESSKSDSQECRLWLYDKIIDKEKAAQETNHNLSIWLRGDLSDQPVIGHDSTFLHSFHSILKPEFIKNGNVDIDAIYKLAEGFKSNRVFDLTEGISPKTLDVIGKHDPALLQKFKNAVASEETPDLERKIRMFDTLFDFSKVDAKSEALDFLTKDFEDGWTEKFVPFAKTEFIEDGKLGGDAFQEFMWSLRHIK